jgi:TldD protein
MPMEPLDPRRRELARAGVQALGKAGVRFGDVRVLCRERQWLQVKGDEVDVATQTLDQGFAVRALVDGAWGFAGAPELSDAAIARAVDAAASIARGSAAADGRAPVSLAPVAPQHGTYRTPRVRDPFDVPDAEKLDLLFRAAAALRTDPRVKVARATAVSLRLRSALCNTEGTDIEQETLVCGGGLGAIATADGEVQRRTYPKDMEGDIHAGGWEHLESLDLVANAPRVADEAIALLSAPTCPAGTFRVVIDGAQMSLQIHESCGHPTELDRALGDEISLAGASFLTPQRVGLRYGSPLVNLYADSTTPGGPGTFGWDDEGTPAGRHDLVKDGVFVGYLGSRETSARIGAPTAAAFRADSWSRLPIVRMVNVHLAPGDWRFEDLVADTDDGLLMSVNKSWSIDELRLNFQFGCEAAWEIKKGKRGRLFKNPVYTGITPQFWGACDAICGADDWRVWGWMFCGKGDPMQIIHVGHGTSPARFNDVQVGARR